MEGEKRGMEYVVVRGGIERRRESKNFKPCSKVLSNTIFFPGPST